MKGPQYNFIITTGHGAGTALLDYLRLFDGVSVSTHRGIPPVMDGSARYNGICFHDLLPEVHYYNALKIIDAQNNVNLCVLTRDPVLQLVTLFNLWMFDISLVLVGLKSRASGRGGVQWGMLMRGSSRQEFFRRMWDLPNGLYFHRTLLDHRLLPFFKNKSNKVRIIETHDVLPENIHSTMDFFKRDFFNSETDYARVTVNCSLRSVYTGWMFAQVPLFQYSSKDFNFSLRPWPLQLNWLQKTSENTYISYEPEEVEWSCGKFDGRLAFNFVPGKDVTPLATSELMPKIREICEADDKKLLRAYCRKTSFTVNMAYNFYETLKTSKEEMLELLKNSGEFLGKFKKRVYAQAAAFHEFGYDVTKTWPVAAELFEGGNMLPEEHRLDHLYAVIDELKGQLLRQGEELEKLTKEKQEKEKQDAALQRKQPAASLSKRQRVLFRLITPVVRRLSSEAQFKRFQENPALFFNSLKKRKYRIFGEIFFPARKDSL